jgi:phosphinothricin acetyltransferase
MTSAVSPSLGAWRMRQATPSDLDAIVAIYNEGIEDGGATCDLSTVSPQDRHAWLDAHSGRFPLFVASDQADRIRGWTALAPYDPKPCFHLTASVSTYVARQARGARLGSTLRAHLVDHARRLGFHVLISRTWAANDASARLSRRCGWEEVGYLREIVDNGGTFVDCRLFQLVLNGRDAKRRGSPPSPA